MKRILAVVVLLLAMHPSAWAGVDSLAIAEGACGGDTIISVDTARQKKKGNFFVRLLKKALDVDTNYIERDKYNVTLKTQSDWRYKQIRLSGSDDDGHSQTLYFSPHSQVTIGPYASCSLLSLGWTIDIGSRLSTHNSNLYLSVYAPMIGIDYYYENDINGYRIRKLRGFDRDIIEESQGMSFPGLSSDMTYIHAYYIFNHRHFSYPAAYSHSTVQRRTSGGLILGYSYSRQQVKFDYEQLPVPFHSDGDVVITDALKVKEVRYINHSLSLGYSFNWVLARNLLLNATASPSIGYNFTKGQKPTADRLYRLRNINFDFVGKVAFVWNTNHMFAGGSFTAHTYTYKKSTFSCKNSLFSAQIYVGVNVWRKKAQKR